MESYWSIIIISNILFFSCMLWMGQTNGKVFLGLLELSNKRGVVILNLEKRLKEIEKLVLEDVSFDDGLDNSSQTTLYEIYPPDYGEGQGLGDE